MSVQHTVEPCRASPLAGRQTPAAAVVTVYASPHPLPSEQGLDHLHSNGAPGFLVCAHGKRFDRERRQFNALARDPWILRAMEFSPAARSDVSRRTLARLTLHLWSLVYWQEVCGKFFEHRAFDGFWLADAEGHHLHDAEFVPVQTLEAAMRNGHLERARSLCISRGADVVFARTGFTIRALID